MPRIRRAYSEINFRNGEIPHFDDVGHFRDFVSKLDDKEIQSWTSCDWNRLYKGIDALAENVEDERVIAYFKERYEGKQISAQQYETILKQLENSPEDALKYRREFFANEACLSSFCKLNRNYRFSEADFGKIVEQSQTIGKKMAQNDLDLAGVILTEGKAQVEVAEKIDETFLKETKYLDAETTEEVRESFLEKHKSVIVQDERVNATAEMVEGVDKAHVFVNSEQVSDNFLEVVSHEYTHAHFQLYNDYQKELYRQGKLPSGLDSDFYELLEYNQGYYLNSDQVEKFANLAADTVDVNESDRVFKKFWGAYKGQPVERYAFLSGITTERAFRQASGQYSERAAMLVRDYLKECVQVEPQSAFYSAEKKITLVYGKDVSFDKVSQVFEGLDKDALQELNIREVEGKIHIDIPSEYRKSSKISGFIKQNGTVSGGGNGVGEQVGKGGVHYAKAKLESQPGKGTNKAPEKARTKSAMKATAAEAKAKVANTAKTAKTAGKAAKETLMAANRAYDDTFDAIMKWGDKHAPQWMNKVEEKTVQKAAEKFMKTKSGQAIAKQIEKKVGKEVAASIAKKIPILCLGVGAMCVCDRLKEGEYLKAVGEGASALVANVPGLGTLASFGLDGAMLSDDLKLFEHGVMPKDPNSHVAAESTFVAKQFVAQQNFIRRVDKAEAEKKAEAKKKATQFEKNLYKYGGKPDFFSR